jgi:HlyD family secretion protein
MQSKPQNGVKTISGESPKLHPSVEKVSLLRRKPNWPILVVLVALFLGVIIWLLAAKKQQPEEEEAVIVSVKVAKAERDSIVSEVTALGTIFPLHEATVSSKIAGQIKQMALLKNKAVKEGDIVATLEARDIQSQRAEAAAAVEEARVNLRSTTAGSIPQTQAQDEKAVRDARANVNNARALYERRVTLYEQGGISKKDVEAAQLALTTAENDLRLAEATARLHAATISPNERATAEAKLKQAEDRLKGLDTQLSYATIRAPFSGVITDQFQFQGEFASPGGKLFTIGDVNDVIVKAPVADTVAAQLTVGGSAKVLPQDLPGEELVGTISLISRASDPQNRTVEVWVNLKNEGAKLRANTAAKVIVSTQSATNVIVVPASAVTLETTTSNEGTVMVVDDKSIANERKVTVGIRTKDKIEITSGLKDGETVVIEGNYALPDNTRVEVSAEEDKSGDSDEKKDTKKGDEK